jgi:hypothetical protein
MNTPTSHILKQATRRQRLQKTLAFDLGVLSEVFLLGELTGLQQASTLQAAFFKLAAGEMSWSPYHGGPL